MASATGAGSDRTFQAEFQAAEDAHFAAEAGQTVEEYRARKVVSDATYAFQCELFKLVQMIGRNSIRATLTRALARANPIGDHSKWHTRISQTDRVFVAWYPTPLHCWMRIACEVERVPGCGLTAVSPADVSAVYRFLESAGAITAAALTVASDPAELTPLEVACVKCPSALALGLLLSSHVTLKAPLTVRCTTPHRDSSPACGRIRQPCRVISLAVNSDDDAWTRVTCEPFVRQWQDDVHEIATRGQCVDSRVGFAPLQMRQWPERDDRLEWIIQHASLQATSTLAGHACLFVRHGKVAPIFQPASMVALLGRMPDFDLHAGYFEPGEASNTVAEIWSKRTRVIDPQLSAHIDRLAIQFGPTYKADASSCIVTCLRSPVHNVPMPLVELVVAYADLPLPPKSNIADAVHEHVMVECRHSNARFCSECGVEFGQHAFTQCACGLTWCYGCVALNGPSAKRRRLV
jgi:hypothetical protein